MFGELLLAGFVASLLTLFDLDRIFYIPASIGQKIRLHLWWWGFIVANGALAALIDLILRSTNPFKDWNEWGRAFVIGLSYMAIIRLKFSTFTVGGKDVPFGFEIFYEAARGFAFKRINSIAKKARAEETIALANSLPLRELGSRVKLSIANDALLAAEDKRSAMAWTLSVLNDANSDELDKKFALAMYILSGVTSAPGG